MIGPRWRKVIRDLWGNKLRTVLVVLSVAAGGFAFGLVAIGRDVLQSELRDQYRATNPAHIVFTLSPFDDDLVQAVAGLREVAEAEGRVVATLNVEIAPDDWVASEVYGIAFETQRINTLTPETGVWPPERRDLLVERSMLEVPGAAYGETVRVRLEDGSMRTLNYGGTVHDMLAFPSQYFRDGYAYINLDTMEWLTGSRQYNQLRVIAADGTLDKDALEELAVDIGDRIEGYGYRVLSTDVPEPGEHWNADMVEAMMILLGTLGVFSIFLSAFLVINTISGVLKQQVRQVGMMKTIGAVTGQVAGIYLVMVLIVGGLSLLVSIPLGALGALGFTTFMARLSNYDIQHFRVAGWIIAGQVGLGLLLPLIAGLVPVLGGTRMTAYQALSDYGIGRRTKRDTIDRLVEDIKRLPRPLLLSVRNTFRRKGRLVLTLLTLTLAGAIFISIFGVRASILKLFNTVFGLFHYDLGITLTEDQRIERVVRETERAPHVTYVEGWLVFDGQVVRADDTEGAHFALFGVPLDTPLVLPQVRAGRWLDDGDVNGIVITQTMVNLEPEVQLGEMVRVKMDGNEYELEVVGLLPAFDDPNGTAGFVYISREGLARMTGKQGYANYVAINTDSEVLPVQLGILRGIQDRYERVGIGVAEASASRELLSGAMIAVQVMVGLMLTMAMLMGFVGGLGLAGTMSLNVIERTREIGVMRAIGASNRSVWGIVVTEGVSIGLISVGLGAVAGVPMTRALTVGIGAAFVGEPLPFVYSWPGVGLWLVLAVVLAAVSSFLPARAAARISVREALSYE